MRLIFYIFLFSQLLNFLSVFAEKAKKEFTEINKINWEKIEENSYKSTNEIIWKSYSNDENYLENKKDQASTTNRINS